MKNSRAGTGCALLVLFLLKIRRQFFHLRKNRKLSVNLLVELIVYWLIQNRMGFFFYLKFSLSKLRGFEIIGIEMVLNQYEVTQTI